MVEIVLLNKKGVTLVEVMISLVILLLVFLALMQTALVSINANMSNVLRDEAVSIAEQRINETRSLPYSTLETASDAADTLPVGVDCPVATFANGTTKGTLVERDFRNIIRKDFCTQRTASTLGAAKDATQVSIQVIWNWKGEAFSHTITTLIRRPS
jgi:prepilin-type N-terminal cleavage/methylation domain-containing protein